jgi:hypothetical protein
MPDASGNFKGISVPSLPKSMEGKTSKDSAESVRSDLSAPPEVLMTPERQQRYVDAMRKVAPEFSRAVEDAHKRVAYEAFQRETRWAGTD